MSGYYAANPHHGRSDIDVDQADAEEAAERHDTFLRKLVDDEYWHQVRGARAILDLETGTATDKFKPGSPEFTAAISAAVKKFTTTVVAAQTAKPARLAELRANDEAEAARAADLRPVVGEQRVS